MPRRGRSYPSTRVYRAVLTLRRQGLRVENYDRDRRLHVIGNAIHDERALVARADAAAAPDEPHSRASRRSTTASAHSRVRKLALAAAGS